MLSSLLIVSIALGSSSVLLVTELRSSQLRAIDGALIIELTSLEAMSHRGAISNPLPFASEETSFVQVLTSGGRVVASSANLTGQGPIVRPTSSTRVTLATYGQLPVGLDAPYRVATITIGTGSSQLALVAGESLAALDQSLHDTIVGLTLADPLLLAIVGATVWWLVGRALSSVEALRREVEVISASQPERRVTVPYVRDEIGRLAETMNQMLARLDDADRRQRIFVADASHELRNPLAAAQSELEVSLTYQDSTRWPESARTVLDDIERVRRIVEDLSLLATYDDRTSRREVAPVDLDELVLHECTRLRRITMRTIDSTGVSGARVVGDAEGLGRAVRNLLDNAVRHSREKVTVSLTHDGHDAVLEILDDGPGVSPQDREKIFERFVRLDSSRVRARGGSGLGLAIVVEVITAHGGTIKVIDGHPGARFVIRLPLSF